MILREQAVTRHKRETGPLRIQAQQAQSIVEAMQDDLDGDAVEEGRLDSLKQQLKDAQDEAAVHTSSYEDCINARDALNNKLRIGKEQMAEKDKLIGKAQEQLNLADAKVITRAGQRETALREKNAAEDDIRRAQGDRASRIELRDRDQENLDSFVMQANEVCPRVPVDKGETPDSIDKKIGKFTKDLDTARRRYVGSTDLTQLSTLEASANPCFQILTHNDIDLGWEEVEKILPSRPPERTRYISRLWKPHRKWRNLLRYATLKMSLQLISIVSPTNANMGDYLTVIEAVSRQPARTMAPVPEIHHFACAGPIFLSAQRAWLPWEIAGES